MSKTKAQIRDDSLLDMECCWNCAYAHDLSGPSGEWECRVVKQHQPLPIRCNDNGPCALYERGGICP